MYIKRPVSLVAEPSTVIQCECMVYYLHTLQARLMSAPFLISIFTTSLCPFLLAMYRGVEPSCVRGIITCRDECIINSRMHYGASVSKPHLSYTELPCKVGLSRIEQLANCRRWLSLG